MLLHLFKSFIHKFTQPLIEFIYTFLPAWPLYSFFLVSESYKFVLKKKKNICMSKNNVKTSSPHVI